MNGRNGGDSLEKFADYIKIFPNFYDVSSLPQHVTDKMFSQQVVTTDNTSLSSPITNRLKHNSSGVVMIKDHPKKTYLWINSEGKPKSITIKAYLIRKYYIEGDIKQIPLTRNQLKESYIKDFQPYLGEKKLIQIIKEKNINAIPTLSITPTVITVYGKDVKINAFLKRAYRLKNQTDYIDLNKEQNNLSFVLGIPYLHKEKLIPIGDYGQSQFKIAKRALEKQTKDILVTNLAEKDFLKVGDEIILKSTFLNRKWEFADHTQPTAEQLENTIIKNGVPTIEGKKITQLPLIKKASNKRKNENQTSTTEVSAYMVTVYGRDITFQGFLDRSYRLPNNETKCLNLRKHQNKLSFVKGIPYLSGIEIIPKQGCEVSYGYTQFKLAQEKLANHKKNFIIAKLAEDDYIKIGEEIILKFTFLQRDWEFADGSKPTDQQLENAIIINDVPLISGKKISCPTLRKRISTPSEDSSLPPPYKKQKTKHPTHEIVSFDLDSIAKKAKASLDTMFYQSNFNGLMFSFALDPNNPENNKNDPQQRSRAIGTPGTF